MKIILICFTLVSFSFSTPGEGLAKSQKNSAGNVKVYRFDNLDVEGKVKAPQLMYFLKRIRSKFRSFRLPKQNFTKEIIEMKDSDLL